MGPKIFIPNLMDHHGNKLYL